VVVLLEVAELVGLGEVMVGVDLGHHGAVEPADLETGVSAHQLEQALERKVDEARDCRAALDKEVGTAAVLGDALHQLLVKVVTETERAHLGVPLRVDLLQKLLQNM
jgi:Tfp pilus assembly PilM family ATPase